MPYIRWSDGFACAGVKWPGGMAAIEFRDRTFTDAFIIHSKKAYCWRRGVGTWTRDLSGYE